LASWLVCICGLIMHELQFDVLFMTVNLTKRGKESSQGRRAPMLKMAQDAICNLQIMILLCIDDYNHKMGGHQQKTFLSGQNDCIRVDVLRLISQRHPGGR